MLGTVLHVLGIIGTVLLVILAIILVLILFVVFAPLKYKFVVKYNAYADNNNICFIKLSWLGQIIKFRADLSTEGIDYVFRLFGFKSKLLDKYLDRSGDNDDEIDDYEGLDESLVTYDKSIDDKSIDKDTGISSKDEKQEDDGELLDEIEQIWEDIVSETDYEQDDYVETTKDKKDKKSSWKKIFTTNPLKIVANFIKKIINTIKGVVKGIISTIKVLIRKYELIIELIEKKSTGVAIERIKKYTSKVFAHIKPRKAKIKLNIGFEDPSKTGYFLAAIGIIYGFVGKIIEINPNFEDEELDIDVIIVGRMRAFNLGIIGFRIMKDKAIKILTKNIGKLKEDLGNGR